MVLAGDGFDPGAVRHAVVWQPPAGFFRGLSGLLGIHNLGAGVDALMARPDLPSGVPVLRLLDAGMGAQMVEYCLYGILHFHRRMDDYRRAQVRGSWQELPAPETARRRVGVLGLGALGRQVAAAAAGLGFPVRGWRRGGAPVAGVETFHGPEALAPFLSGCDILVNLLPLTDDTRGLLNRERLGMLPAGACLINAARGAHVVTDDLIAGLDSGHLRGALLDVFDVEPLPVDHPLWRHPRIVATPHIAAQTLVGPAVAQIADNIRRLEAGQTPVGLVDPEQGC
ncbi:2-hydroxyacid dehydrogenase [Roseospirillum parvum]|uniref:2-hydroxyacid dehydrogenase n=1 Tax=Roseospirillum parvum TaxID=83401 RepID=UPI001FE0A512|nr:glyoxylate/hydroxypyruvate reductase A [Roseospirillum parvum]